MTVETIQGVDSWAPVLAQVAELAASIADTDFVPSTLRKKPAAIAAAILTGRELGVGPMTALANIYVVNGKPGMSATLMRQLVLAAGHEIRYETATDSRCVVKGRRRGEDEWTQVTFTAEQAARAKINLGGYPEDKLIARATARLCRRAFADCLGGMPYLAEEHEDEAEGETVTIPAARKTAKRASSPLKLASPPEPEAIESTPVGTPDVDEPPLDDLPPREERPFAVPSDFPMAQARIVGGTDVDEDEPVALPPGESEASSEGRRAAAKSEQSPAPSAYVDELLRGETDDFPDPTVVSTPEQIVAIVARLAELGIRERTDRLNVTRILAGRPEMISSKSLTKADASAVLDTLTRVLARPDPKADLHRLIAIEGPISREAVSKKLKLIEGEA